jgi:hypothetical protein
MTDPGNDVKCECGGVGCPCGCADCPGAPEELDKDTAALVEEFSQREKGVK